MGKQYSEKQIDFIRSIAPGRTRDEITDLFNAEFGTDKKPSAMRSLMSRQKIKTCMQGHATRFAKGYEPWNKGKKGLNKGGEETWFKKGHTTNAVPIGSERVEDGFVDIKVKQPNVWAKKHRIIWEAEYGPIPDTHVILFKDNDKMNVTMKNLYMVPRAAMTSVSIRKLRTEHSEINQLTHKLAELELTIKQKEQGK